MHRTLSTFLASLAVFLALPLAAPAPMAHAESAVQRGLLITPVKQQISVDAGTAVANSLVVANLTQSPQDISLSVKQFSVANYTYDYTFQPPENDWLRLGITSQHLDSGQSKTIPYTITVPARTAPGGHYYTLFASAKVTTGGVSNTIQAADLLYLTVNGKLTKVSHLEDSSIPWLVVSKDVPFTLHAINTGNIYSYVYVSGQLHGLLVKPAQTSTGHILIPGHVRTLSSSIDSPVLPGIYRAVYGYKTEGNWIVQETHWIVYLPPWFIAFTLAALLVGGGIVRRKRRSTKQPAASASDKG